MQISVRCQSCKNEFEVESYYRGLIVSCPECNGLVKVDQGDYQSSANRGNRSRQVDATSSTDGSLDSWSDDKSKADNGDRVSHNRNPKDDSDRSWDSHSPTRQPANSNDSAGTSKYHVRTADGSVYGAVDAATVLRWGQEGRLSNDTSVRQDGSDVWTNFPDWKEQIARDQQDSRSRGTDPAGTYEVHSRHPRRLPNEHDFRPVDGQVFRPTDLATDEQADTVEIGHNNPTRFGGKNLNGRLILVLSIASYFSCLLFPFSIVISLFLLGYAWHKLSIRIGDSNLAGNEPEFIKERIFIVIGMLLLGILTCLQMLFIAAWLTS